ncbi:MAG: 50S ribosomal protein L35 [Planctomycetota bacterium]
MAKLNAFKPHKGILKRIRISGNGKIKMKHAGLGHLCSHKSGNRRRRLRAPFIVAPCEVKRLRKMIG